MISVIVPAYNLENYIERTIRSILNQTYQDIEIIVVDDGSKDKTVNVVEKIVEQNPEKIKLIRIPNGGVTNARLTGVEQAKGEWIGFVDGDDEIEPDMYEFLLNNALKYRADISHCGYQMIFEDGRVNYFYNTGCLIQQDRTTGLKDLLDGSLIEPGLCNKLFHKTLLHNLFQQSVMPKEIKINEDLLMNYYLFREAKMSVFEDKCPYHYIVRKTSASRQKLNSNKIYDPIRVKKIIVDTEDKGIKKEAQKAYLSTCINIYNLLMLEKKDKYRKDIQNVREYIVQKREWTNLLGKKQKILADLIVRCPSGYRTMYRVYEKLFQKKVYE